MQQLFFVRIGKWGEIWVGESAEPLNYARGTRVVCRTGRGLELGEIVSPVEMGDDHQTQGFRPPHHPCSIVRGVTPEDDLLELRLQRHKQAAVRDCQSELRKREISVTLLDVEHLFDGRTLIFHFAGEFTGEVQRLVDDLTDVYEKRARSQEFAKLLTEGCGPGCGTEEGQGCGSRGGCAMCIVAGACSTRS